MRWRRRRGLERLRRWIAGAMLLPPAFACGGGDEAIEKAKVPDEGPLDPGGIPPPKIHAPPAQLAAELLGPELGAPTSVIDLSFDEGGTLWIAGSDGLYVRPAGARFFSFIGVVDGLSRAPLRAVGGLGPGLALVAYDGAPPQLVRLSAEATVEKVEDTPLSPLVAEIRPVDLEEGRFALAATGAGLAVLDAGGIVVAQRSLPPPALELWSLAATANGDVWVGDAGRLARVEGPFTEGLRAVAPVLDLVEGADDDVVAIDVCPDGDVWASTLGHGLVHLTPGGEVIERLTKEEVLPQDHVTALACDLDGSVWIGTSWGGIARRSPAGAFTYHAATAGLPGDSIRSLLVRPDGAGGRAVWIGTNGGAAFYVGP